MFVKQVAILYLETSCARPDITMWSLLFLSIAAFAPTLVLTQGAFNGQDNVNKSCNPKFSIVENAKIEAHCWEKDLTYKVVQLELGKCYSIEGTGDNGINPQLIWNPE